VKYVRLPVRYKYIVIVLHNNRLFTISRNINY